ncbi:hypothetical protein GN156_38920, partial [bacterium LRH843]|nr:hypothetical protein [bacterium LRH843]
LVQHALDARCQVVLVAVVAIVVVLVVVVVVAIVLIRLFGRQIKLLKCKLNNFSSQNENRITIFQMHWVFCAFCSNH